MRHPLSSLQARTLGLLTGRLAGLLIFSTALIIFVDVPLQGDASPWGIVSFELAGTPFRALQILLEWKSRGALGYAKLILAVDFVYLVVYGMFFASLCAWVGARLEEPTWSRRAVWAATLAAGFDVLENGALLYELTQFTTHAPWPQLAASFAAAKFVLLIGAAAYGIVGAVLVWRRRQ